VYHGSAYTVVRSTRQSYGDSKISGVRTPKPLNWLTENLAWAICMPKQKTRGSAMAEGLRDALVSRNSATTKHPIWNLESRAYRVALFVWSYV